MRSEINFQELKQYLQALKYSDIETDWHKPANPKLISGKSVGDIEYFRVKNVPDEKIIRYGEPFLVDALGNDLSILILTKKRYRLPSGRVVNAKFVTTVVDDCRSLFGTPLNGYWKIPSQFIKKI